MDKNDWKQKNGYSTKQYAVILFLIIALFIILVTSISNYFSDKKERDSQPTTNPITESLTLPNIELPPEDTTTSSSLTEG